MAAEAVPAYEFRCPLQGTTKEQFLILALEAAARLGLVPADISLVGIVLHATNSLDVSVRICIEMREGNAEFRIFSIGSEIANCGFCKGMVDQLISEIEELRRARSPEDLGARYETLQRSLPPSDREGAPPPKSRREISGLMAMFLPSRDYFVTPIIVDLNILVFVLMAICGAGIMSPDGAILLHWGANFRPYTLEGQWWRLIINFFLHFGALHLLMNMYALVLIGTQLEPRLGRIRFLGAYMLAGIAASVNSLIWHENTISAGASGAIFGMYGVFLALLTTNLIDKAARKPLLTSIGVFVAYNLMNGLKGGVDNAAHVGGLLVGIIMGYAWYPDLKQPAREKYRFASLALIAFVIIGSSLVVYNRLPNDIGVYEKGMNEFAATETAALQAYNLPQTASPSSIARAFRNEGMGKWKHAIEIIDSMDKLRLPETIHQRNYNLRDYCNLRLDVFDLTARRVEENTNSYEDRIDDDNRQITAILHKMAQGTK